MKVATRIGLVVVAVVVWLGVASAAYAADYPPTTSAVSPEGASVPVPTSISPDTASVSPSGGLPFTGGNDGTLVWVGVAAVGAGTAATWRFRRHARVS